MALEISKDILAKASRCTRNQQCTSGEATSCSEPEAHFVGKQRFICYSVEPCAYKIPFGSNFFCTCPVRAEVFRQTGK